MAGGAELEQLAHELERDAGPAGDEAAKVGREMREESQTA